MRCVFFFFFFFFCWLFFFLGGGGGGGLTLPVSLSLSCYSIKAKINVISTPSNLIAEVSLRTVWHKTSS